MLQLSFFLITSRYPKETTEKKKTIIEKPVTNVIYFLLLENRQWNNGRQTHTNCLNLWLCVRNTAFVRFEVVAVHCVKVSQFHVTCSFGYMQLRPMQMLHRHFDDKLYQSMYWASITGNFYLFVGINISSTFAVPIFEMSFAETVLNGYCIGSLAPSLPQTLM